MANGAQRVLCLDWPKSAASGPTPHCCADMAGALAYDCPQHDNPFDCPDALLYYAPQLDEYGLIVHDGSGTYVLIDACPWCGTRLPESRRDAWFDALEALGLAPLGDDIPEDFKSDLWWRKRQTDKRGS
jgi:hypothetical protein